MIILDKPEAEYHADPTTLSQSGAKTLLRSPRQFRYEREHPKPSTESMKTGTVTHELVFFGEVRTVVQQDWDGRTTAGKKAKADAEAKGLEIVSAADWRLAHNMAEAIQKHPQARQLFTEGRPEVSVYGEDPLTGVAKRGRFDWWRDDGMIVDLKTAEDASPSGFARSVAKYKYHVQDAWYTDLAFANGHPAARFVFVVVEKAAPHLIGIYQLDEAAVSAGFTLADRACQVYRDCLEAEEMFGPDAWPEWGRPTEPIEKLTLPRWSLTEVDDPAWL